jgi:hypothetical protein
MDSCAVGGGTLTLKMRSYDKLGLGVRVREAHASSFERTVMCHIGVLSSLAETRLPPMPNVMISNCGLLESTSESRCDEAFHLASRTSQLFKGHGLD